MAAKKSKMGKKAKSVNMAGAKPFEMSKKKPEPDDRPRPFGKPSVNKNTVAKKNPRVARLTGLKI